MWFRSARVRSRCPRRLGLQIERGLQLLFYVLGTLAFVTFTAALLFPAEEEKPPAKENGGPSPPTYEEGSTMKSLHAVAPVHALLTGAAAAQTIGIVTRRRHVFKYAGQADRQVLDRQSKAEAIVQAQASHGFDEVESGTATSMCPIVDATSTRPGRGITKGPGKKPAIRYSGSLVPYRWRCTFVRLRYQGISDLRGKRVQRIQCAKNHRTDHRGHLANADSATRT